MNDAYVTHLKKTLAGETARAAQLAKKAQNFEAVAADARGQSTQIEAGNKILAALIAQLSASKR